MGEWGCLCELGMNSWRNDTGRCGEFQFGGGGLFNAEARRRRDREGFFFVIGMRDSFFVIASEARQSPVVNSMAIDCFVPRNDKRT